MDDILLLCEDSIEGILSGVYEAYSLKKDHNHIHLHLGKIDNYQLFATYREVAVDDGKSARVLKTIWERLGEEAYTGICRAMASEDVNKADSVYHAIVLGLSGNCRGPLMQNLSNEDVQTVFKLSRYVCNEILHVNGFLRFKELETGILFADFGPRNNLLTFIMPHFANRFPNENFAIFDSIRKIYGIHPAGKEWYMAQGEQIDEEILKKYSDTEEAYQELFRHFCHTIGIKERKNADLQRNMLPLRFRGYMVEFN